MRQSLRAPVRARSPAVKLVVRVGPSLTCAENQQGVQERQSRKVGPDLGFQWVRTAAPSAEPRDHLTPESPQPSSLRVPPSDPELQNRS